MAGTSTVPSFAGAANKRVITLSMIDASGDTDSVSFPIAAAATDAQVQALIDAYQASTQASLYKVTDNFTYQGIKVATNATSDQRSSVKDGINMLFRDGATLATETLRIKAPVTTIMDANKDIPLMSGATLTALSASVVALNPAFGVESGQYTEHVERAGQNPRVSA